MKYLLLHLVPGKKAKIIFMLLACTTWLHAQVIETDSWRNSGELKMTFPGIYFEHNSIDYAAMPYTVDSSFKYMALHVKDIYSFVIWRDSSETEDLSNKRIIKLKLDLNKYTPSNRIDIRSMGVEQKISRRTIDKAVDSTHFEYLLSLNSVFDISKTRFLIKKKWKYKSHIELPRLWCLSCWRHGFHIKERKRIRAAKRAKANIGQKVD
jgi:hypothetical protein